MRSSYISFLALPLFAAAFPLAKRSASQTDLTVLQFAFVLEQLETTFYAEAIKTFQASDFLAAGYTSAEVAVEQLTVIQGDEATHTSVLGQTILDQGGVPLTSCQFNFASALKDVSTTMATARVVELVGVGAYLGAASLISDPQLLTAAASILTVEARHQTVLNLLSGGGVAIPSAFDLPLSPPQVLAIASPFISGCSLGLSANLPLAVTNTGSIGVGTSLTFDLSPLGGRIDSSGLSCQMLVGGATFAIVQPLSQCIVPKISGPVLIYITNDPQPLLSSNFAQFTNEIMLGPTIAFIDSITQTLPQLVRTGGGTADSTNVVSNSQASSIVSNAQSTDSGSQATGSSDSNEPQATGYSSSGSSTDNNNQSSNTNSASSPESSSSGTANVSSSSANVPEQQPGGPNFAVGRSGDGHTVVQGWQDLPAGISPP